MWRPALSGVDHRRGGRWGREQRRDPAHHGAEVDHQLDRGRRCRRGRPDSPSDLGGHRPADHPAGDHRPADHRPAAAEHDHGAEHDRPADHGPADDHDRRPGATDLTVSS
jgi:hypothetical protein